MRSLYFDFIKTDSMFLSVALGVVLEGQTKPASVL